MDNNFKGVLELDETYKEFIKTVVANDRVWFLFCDGRVAIAETEAGPCIALWSSKEAATKNQMGEWSEFNVQGMAIAEFLVMCVPEFIEDDVNVMIGMQDGEGIWKNTFAVDDDLRAEAEVQGIDLEGQCEEIKERMIIDENYVDMICEIVKNGCAWTLFSDDSIAMAEFEGEDAIPLWASEEDAEEMTIDEWEGCTVDSISLEELLEELLPMLGEDEVSILFSTDSGSGVAVDAYMLIEDLTEAMQEFSEFSSDDEIDLSNVIPFPKLQ